jgi:hypothetical protein
MQRLYSVTFVLRDGTKHDTADKALEHCKEKMYQILCDFGSQFTPVKVANWAQAVENSTYDEVFSEYLAWRKEHDDLLNYEQDNEESEE